MEYYSLLAVFFAPVFGLIILNGRYNFKISSLILNYLNIVIIANLITNIIIYIFRNYSYLYFSQSFFIKYSLFNIIFSVFIALLEIIIIENIKVKLITANDKKK